MKRNTAASSPTNVPPIVSDAVRSPGRSLDAASRSFMETRFGHDFSQVRIHSGPLARASAEAINARAYTVGQDIVFGKNGYVPGRSQDRQTLAHELAHTVQQGNTRQGLQRLAIVDDARERALESEADAVARRVVSGGYSGGLSNEPVGGVVPVRRQADLNQAPGDLPCILVTGLAPSTGANLLFELGGSAVSANHLANLQTFVRAWVANGSSEDVIVEGYASVDGTQASNWRLSCYRAEATKTALVGLGIPTSRITTFASGETDVFSASNLATNRRAIVSAVPAAAASGTAGPVPAPAPGGSAPNLSAVVSVGPAAATCGGMNFVITWNLSGNAATNGGFVIQEVSFNWSVLDCSGTAVPNPDPRVSPLTYFEAWRVAANSTAMTPVNTDTFFWPGGLPWGGTATTGNVNITAVARYHDNVAALPAHMVANNPATFAGGLRSSLTDPALGGSASPTVPHSLTFHWDCCPSNTNPTILDGHQP